MNQFLSRILLALVVTLSFVSPAFAATLEGLCTAAHDGDTITVLLDGKKENIRLIGVDAPELAQKPWGPKAGDFTRGLVVGKTVRVETDVTPRDKYGRLLGYAFVGGTFVNLELVRQGYAMVYTYPPNVSHTSEFVSAQGEARAASRNIWDQANGLTETPSDFRHRKHERIRSDVKQFKQAKPQSNQPKAGAHLVSMNVKSGKYHEPGCRYYGCGNCSEMTLAEAEAAGGVPCKVCH